MPKKIAVLGATGSIGENTLAVIAQHPEQYEVWALTAYQQTEKLFTQCQTFQPTYAVMVDPHAAHALEQLLKAVGSKTQVLSGAQALEAIVSDDAVNIVVLGMVGAVGLAPCLAAVRARKRVLLANKEVLVMAGEYVMAQVRIHQTEFLPLDSEHNAIFQCLPLHCQTLWQGPDLIAEGLEKITLTASGGPFLKTASSDLAQVTPQQACAHPNWQMGKKISVDSATLMNKGLEFIEACHLFKVPPQTVDVLIHPQSIIHSMVSWCDGSLLAQMGQPDMKIPIAYGLSWPKRMVSGAAALDWRSLTQLEFELPDLARFSCLALAIQAVQTGGTAPTILNAANEIAVANFLAGRISFVQIPQVIETALTKIPATVMIDIEQVLAVDQHARRVAAECTF